MTTITNTILVADEGKMLYNGETYSEKVFVGRLDSVDNWQEVPYTQYEEWLAEQEKEMEEAAKASEARANAEAEVDSGAESSEAESAEENSVTESSDTTAAESSGGSEE